MAQVRITELRGGSSQVELGLTGGTVVSARPSDAVALPLHAGVGIWAEDTVLGVAEGVPDEGPSGAAADTGETGPPDDEELARFRRFLNLVFPEDFDLS